MYFTGRIQPDRARRTDRAAERRQHAARKLKRAQILLAADVGVSDEDIAISVAVGGSTVYRTKRRFVEGDLAAALSEEPRPGATRKLTGKEEALLVATGLLHAARGPGRWTLELLAGAMVRPTGHDGLSRETVRRRLAENELKPWRKDMWCIPQIDGNYVARMEDVLDLYAEEPDPRARGVLDESPSQLIGEVRQPIPAAPERNIGIARPRIHGQHVLHGGDECAVGFRRNDPLLFQMRLKDVFLRIRPIVLSLARSTMFSSTTLFANTRNVQRARPLGGSESRAISLASFSPSKILERQAWRAAFGSTPPRSPLPPAVCAPGRPWMGWSPGHR